MAVQPVDELVSQIAKSATPRQRLGTVVSIDKSSTSAWLANVKVGSHVTPRPMRWTGDHHLQVGERVVWTDDGSSLPVILGRPSTFANRDMDFGDGTVNSWAFRDDQGSLREVIHTAEINAVNANIAANYSMQLASELEATINYWNARMANFESRLAAQGA